MTQSAMMIWRWSLSSASSPLYYHKIEIVHFLFIKILQNISLERKTPEWPENKVSPSMGPRLFVQNSNWKFIRIYYVTVHITLLGSHASFLIMPPYRIIHKHWRQILFPIWHRNTGRIFIGTDSTSDIPNPFKTLVIYLSILVKSVPYFDRK